uniref:Uncharacterized protein n=1 Tax=Ralstonia syzygii R24 TaxID=907261 RepID=G2ZZ94_9RALS|nr:hypothetical protein RALSY_10149 [Ralstonia syzygii R24]
MAHEPPKRGDVLAYKETMRQTRNTALDELVAQSEVLGGYDL